MRYEPSLDALFSSLLKKINVHAHYKPISHDEDLTIKDILNTNETIRTFVLFFYLIRHRKVGTCWSLLYRNLATPTSLIDKSKYGIIIEKT